MSNTKPQRKNSLRLQGYDYSQPGAYFVTIVTHQRECLFGEIIDGEMRLNELGKIVHYEWLRLARQFDFIELGASSVMPNHFHGIIEILDVGATRLDINPKFSDKKSFVFHENLANNQEGSPLPAKGPIPQSLSAIIGQFKSRVTKRIHQVDPFSPERIWQRGFYDHIIRNKTEWKNIHLYIESNPSNWATDNENPLNLL